MNWRYCIVPEKDVTQEMADLGHYSSVEYMRKSNDGYILVKWQGAKPRCLYGIEEIDLKKELIKERWNVEE